MINELGHLSLILALAIAVVQVVAPAIGIWRHDPALTALAGTSAKLQFLMVICAFAALTHAFAVSDFSVRLVAQNSHTAKPFIYKLTGVWGNHEGSMLLWVMVIALYGACVATFAKDLPGRFCAMVLAVQGMIGVLFIAFVIFTSNPFVRLEPPPFDGRGLNPLLQDPGLAMHPPFLYLGYAGLSVPFSFAMAALMDGGQGGVWARMMRPWVLLAWASLTVGIGLGSWWAYYELGWGGFWFWDPVENASLMPWLMAAALLHSAIGAEKRGILLRWTVLLAIMGFAFSLLGTFIVRSGILTSVHAFASDPTRGLFILAIFALVIGSALGLFAARAGKFADGGGVFSLASRETALIGNNLLLSVSTFVVFIGTIWPLIAEIVFDRTLTVGPPFFEIVFTPLFVLLAAVLPLGAILPWKRARIAVAMRRLAPAGVLAAALGLLIFALQNNVSALAPIGLALGVWLISGSIVDLGIRAGVVGQGRAFSAGVASLRRLVRLKGADWARALAHAGLGVAIIGISAITAWEEEDIRHITPGERFAFGAYEIEFVQQDKIVGPNYTARKAEIKIFQDNRLLARMYPERRTYPVSGTTTTEAAIHGGVWRDLYLALGDQQHDGGGTVLRSWIKPMVSWLWAGVAMMAAGGLLSLFSLGNQTWRRRLPPKFSQTLAGK